MKPNFNPASYWYIDRLRETSCLGIECTRSLFDQNSPYQNIKILETKGFGNMLIIDDFVMSCEKDEFIYSEMISHVPLFSHPNPKDILIIGGGNGGTAREVLKHKNINQCVMAEIDELVITASKKYLKSASIAFDNPKLDLNIANGADFITKYKSAFDIIIVDNSVNSPSAVLFSRTFYEKAHTALKKEGIIVTNYFNYLYDVNRHKPALRKIAKSGFDKAGFYSFNNISLPPGAWSFLFASKGPHPIKTFNSERVKNSGIFFRYYNEEIHKACFARAQFIKEFFGEDWTL
ncbi:MAG: polyamine aminopropyltransferase [Oligoflexia bacterium]|nr:polyamine aminopropyltransferase [Oligoflexia bacterium]